MEKWMLRMVLVVLAVVSVAVYSGNAGAALVVGTSGADNLVGTEGNDVIRAYAGDDYVAPDKGMDVVYLGSGNDVGNGIWPNGGAGADVFRCGLGKDRLTLGWNDQAGANCEKVVRFGPGTDEGEEDDD